jgi:predicted RNA binding protein YcfA (HicA-like mRNA interferase family)
MSRRTKSLRPSELIRLLEKAGWSQKRQTGSHVILVKEGQRSIPVPVHAKELKRALMMAIFKQAGLTPEEVEKLLAE